MYCIFNGLHSSWWSWPGGNLFALFVAGRWLLLVISIITAYPITSDGHPLVEEASDLPLGQPAGMGR